MMTAWRLARFLDRASGRGFGVGIGRVVGTSTDGNISNDSGVSVSRGFLLTHLAKALAVVAMMLAAFLRSTLTSRCRRTGGVVRWRVPRPACLESRRREPA